MLGGDWCNTEWLCQAEILPLTRLDHFPICLNIWKDATPEQDPFRFEKMWLRKEGFLDMVKVCWETAPRRKGNLAF